MSCPRPYKTGQKRLALRRREDTMKSMRSAVGALAPTLCSPRGVTRSPGRPRKAGHARRGGKTALYYLPLTICERLGY
jgi:hypothetical protein